MTRDAFFRKLTPFELFCIRHQMKKTDANGCRKHGCFIYNKVYHHEARIHHIGMRHFDPASEDDMDDNGMSRFMDSNDDEGWD